MKKNDLKRLKKEKFVKENVYNEQLQDKYMRKVLEEDKKFDDDFETDWEV